MRKFFITSSGTDVGKTFVASALTFQLRELGHSVGAFKPIATGFEDGKASDTTSLLDVQGLSKSHKNVMACTPWRFKLPASPDIAAAAENQEIDFNAVVDFCNKSALGKDFSLFEGIGGVMTPLTDKFTNLDLAIKLKFPVILVVGTYLGAISHALTAYHALKAKKIDNLKLVITESDSNPNSVEATANSIANFTECEILVIPRVASENYKFVPDITSLVL